MTITMSSCYIHIDTSSLYSTSTRLTGVKKPIIPGIKLVLKLVHTIQ